MTDIVERLERLATWGGNATHLDYEGAILDAKAEIERLRDENARPHLNYEAVLLESKGEIDRLRTDNERLRGVEHDAVEWVEERTRRLRADNERLRAALTRLVAWEGPVELACPELGGLLKAMYDARSALKAKDD